MVEILCPHCEGELELDDDASGEFECPLCDGKFEWNVEEEESFDDTVTHTENRIVPSQGFDKMDTNAKVVAGVYVGYKAVQTVDRAIRVSISVIFLVFFVILMFIYLFFGPIR